MEHGTTRYLVLIEKSKTGYAAYAPDLPGCIATGKTIEEVERAMHDAMEFHLDTMAERGESQPDITHVLAETFAVRNPFASRAPRPAAVLGRKGGSARSERKSLAARANGSKGGRPRKHVTDV